MRILVALPFLLLLNVLQAQTIREVILPFNTGQCYYFESDVKHVIDSVYFTMQKGEKTKLCLFNRYERQKCTHAQLVALTSKRYQLVNTYLDLKRNGKADDVFTILPKNDSLVFDKFNLIDNNAPEFNKPIPGIPAIMLVKNEDEQKRYTKLIEDHEVHLQQDFQIYTSLEQKIYANGGTIVTIPANSFVFENNAACNCSTVDVIVEEYLTTPEMLLANLSTHNNGKMLETGGMVYIEAKCNGKKLKLGNGKSISIFFPANDVKPNMRVWDGRKTESIFDWLLQKRGTVTRIPEDVQSKKSNLNPLSEREVFYETDEGEGYYDDSLYNNDGISDLENGYLLESFNLGWINCDRFYDVKNKTNLMVYTDQEIPVACRLVFSSIRSIMPAYESGKKSFTFSDIPVGENAILLVYYINKEKTKAYFYASSIITGRDKSQQVILKEVAPNQIKNQFSDLFPG